MFDFTKGPIYMYWVYLFLLHKKLLIKPPVKVNKSIDMLSSGSIEIQGH